MWGLRRDLAVLATAAVVAAGLMAASPEMASASVAPPSISGIAPASGKIAGGTTVTVTGANFSKVTAVEFGAVKGSAVKVVSGAKLTVVAPKHAAGLVRVEVVTAHGTSPSVTADRYTYVAPPAITRVTPTSGKIAGGTTVTVTGANFSKVTAVEFGAVKGSAVKVVSGAKLTVVAPRHAAGPVDVRVLTAYGASPSVSADRYTFVAPPAVSNGAIAGVTTTGVTLTWTNPAQPGFAGVVIRRATGPVAPATPSGGTAAVRTGGQVDEWTDKGLTPGHTYSYALFADDGPGTGYAAANTVTVTLPTEPALTGTITDAGGGPVGGVSVIVTGSNGIAAGQAITAADGAYSVAGLATGSYTVCFDPVGGNTGAGGFGFAPQCWKNQAADGAPTPVAIAAGATLTGIDATLAPAGSISGTVQDSGSHPIAGVTVEVDDTGGEPVDYATTDKSGNWTASGLDAGSYTVCFDPITSYAAQCFNDIAPTAVPTPITVTAGNGVAGIDATLQAVAPLKPDIVAPTSGNGEIASTSLSSVACADVLFLAARGSGESGPGGVKNDPGDTDEGVGAPVYTAYQAFVPGISDGRTVTPPISVSYPADNVFPNVAELSYIHDLWQGVKEARRALTARAAQCPNERIVLAGFSQGAMIMHRIMTNATTKGVTGMAASILGRVDAVIMIGDGDRVAHDTTNDYGSARSTAQGVGTQLDTTITPAKLPKSIGVRMFSVCNAHDIVCDFNIPYVDLCAACTVGYGIHVHLSYGGAEVVEHASTDAAAWEQTFPAFGGAPLAVADSVGVPLLQQLTARYDVKNVESVSWSLPPHTTLPVGLAIDSDGFISGTPTAAGKSVIDLQAVATTSLGVWEAPVAVAVAFAISPAGTTTVAVPTWTAQNLPVPSDASTSALSAVSASCVSISQRTECAAAGTYSTSAGFAGALWMFQQGKWTVTKAVLPDGGDSWSGWECAGNCGGGQPIACGESGICAAIGSYQSSTGVQEYAVWVWTAGSWTVTQPPLPGNAAEPQPASVQAVSCGATCGITLYYTDTGSTSEFAVGIWQAGTWQVVEPALPSDGVSFYPNWASSITCGLTCVAMTDYMDAIGNWFPTIWTWSRGTWKEGLPWPGGDGSGQPGTGQCSADLCLLTSWGYIAGAFREAFWLYYDSQWHYVPVPTPSDASTKNADGGARIQSLSCRDALCAMSGTYVSTAGGQDARWVLEGTSVRVFKDAVPVGVGDPVRCSRALCATLHGQVFDPAKGYWVGTNLPAPGDDAVGETTACAAAGCVAGGAYAESGAPNGNPWTSAAWAWVGGAWHLAPLSPEYQGNQYSPQASSCGAEICVMPVVAGSPGNVTAQLWMSSAFVPEG
jgi:hypothetical protein